MEVRENNDGTMSGRERFLRAFANIPIASRDEVIAVLNEEPVSWRVAYFEVKNDTPRGKAILDQLEVLTII